MANQGLIRGFGLLQATALNMTNMVGIGPFITIPLVIAAMGGPQCMLGWVAGAVVALCDGLVWAELAAAMPGAGGSFLYLREAFRGTRAGALLPFLFIWQFIFSGPLEIASGYIGFAQYLGYYFPSMTGWQMRAVAMTVGLAAVGLLYRRITAIARLTVVLWIGMLVTVVWVIGSGLAHFNPRLAFDFPPGAFRFSTGFAMGLGSAMLVAMYDFLGYYDICFVAGEVRRPERTVPRAILLSVVAVALIYALLNLCIMAVIPWREAMQSKYVVAQFMEAIYGPWGGRILTGMILWTAFASVFALLLGYSRIPYAAASEGYFLKPFARLHRGGFPHVGLLTIGGLAILASLLNLEWVLSALITARVLIQFIGQIAALYWIRKHRPDIHRPFRMWLYPLPALVALAGWAYIFATSGVTFMLSGTGVLASGVVAYWFWQRRAA